MESEILKIDVQTILKDYQEMDTDHKFERYLVDIWNDLSQRSEDPEKGIEKVTFNKYYVLPGILSERLFSIFDKDKDGLLSYKEFIIGMKTLFTQNVKFDYLAKFIFNFYDFNSKGKISKDDVRVVLSYVPLERNPGKNKEKIENDFLNPKESQDVLNSILDTAFQGKKQINLDEFMNVVKNKNSDILILLLIFLLEKKPFSVESYKSYHFDMNVSPLKMTSRTPVIEPFKIASPSLNSKYISPILRKKTIKAINGGEIKFEDNDILQLYSGTSNINSNKKDNTKSNFVPGNAKEKEEQKEKEGKRIIQRRDRMKLENLSNKSPLFSFRKVYDNMDGEEAETNDLNKDFNYDENEKSKTIRYEGYIYKFSEEGGGMKKIFFKLIGKDLYYYRKKGDEQPKGMHNLSDAFPLIGENKIHEGNNYFSIMLKFPQKQRNYYFLDEKERDIWIQKIQLVLENKKLKDKYDIIKTIGKGKFGLVKLGINKENNQKVAIKILAKNQMDKEDIELAKTEIDILKVSQYKNIIKLYDTFETDEHYYIVMEYCDGGDLLNYFEKRDRDLPESKVCQIIYKLSKAIEFLHTYGIIHRDLKPDNILMTGKDDNADIRISDFGLSKIIGPNNKCSEPFGTLSYAAPEVLLNEPYDKSVDLWGIGIITYLLLSGELPFDDQHSEIEISRQTIEDDPEFSFELWGHRSKEAIKFVEGLLKKKPSERMTMKELLVHPWFKKYINLKKD